MTRTQFFVLALIAATPAALGGFASLASAQATDDPAEAARDLVRRAEAAGEAARGKEYAAPTALVECQTALTAEEARSVALARENDALWARATSLQATVDACCPLALP